MIGTSAALLVELGRRAGGLRSLLLHPAGGGLGPYLGVALQLDRLGPVHGIRAAGLLPGEEPDEDVTSMVDRYRPLLDRLDGPPDLLFGWSLGGVLAWELAAGLTVDGHRPRVVMVDSPALPHPAGDTVRGKVVESVGLDAALVRRTADAHIAAVARHRVHTEHDGPALLLACAGEDNAADVAAWRTLGAGLRTETLSGGHFDVFTPRVLPVLSARVREFLTDTEEK